MSEKHNSGPRSTRDARIDKARAVPATIAGFALAGDSEPGVLVKPEGAA
jgi:hypothetical protein